MRRSLTTSAVVLFLTLVIVSAGQAQEIFQEEEGLFSTRPIKKTVSMKAGERIEIRSASTLIGKIVISTGRTDQASLVYIKRSKSESRSKAIDHIDLIAVDLDRVAAGTRLQLRAPNPAPWSSLEAGMVEAELVLPENSVVDIEATYFDIEATGPFKGVLIPASLGRIDVSDVAGELDIATANRRVTVKDITGKVSVETSHSSLTAINISSDGEQSSFRNNGGDITIDGFAGQISVRNSYGRIELVDFAPTGDRNVIRGRSAPVVLEITRLAGGQLVLNNRLEDIDITVPIPMSAVLSLSVEEDGKIEVSNVKFQTDLVRRDRLSLIAGDGDTFISGSVSGRGNIYVRGIETGED